MDLQFLSVKFVILLINSCVFIAISDAELQVQGSLSNLADLLRGNGQSSADNTDVLKSLLNHYESLNSNDAQQVSQAENQGHRISQRKFDPDQLLAEFGKEDNQLHSLASSPGVQAGYSSGQSAQDMAGVFIGYSASQDHNNDWSGSLDTGEVNNEWGGRVDQGNVAPMEGVSSDHERQQQQSSSQQKGSQQKQQQGFGVSDGTKQQAYLLGQDQLYDNYQDNQQQQQIQQQASQAYNSLSQQQGYNSLQGHGSDNPDVTGGTMQDQSSLQVLQFLGGPQQPQQFQEQGSLSEISSLSQNPYLGNVDQLGNLAQLSEQAFPEGKGNDGQGLGQQGTSNRVGLESPSGSVNQAGQMSSANGQNVNGQGYQTGSDSSNVQQSPQVQNNHQQQETKPESGSGSETYNFQEQLERIQNLISQLQQQQQLLLQQQQSQTQQQVNSDEDNTETTTKIPFTSTIRPIVTSPHTITDDEKGQQNEEHGNKNNADSQPNNDFGNTNTAGSISGPQISGQIPSQGSTNGEGKSQSPPIFVAGGDVNNLYGNTSERVSPTSKSETTPKQMESEGTKYEGQEPHLPGEEQQESKGESSYTGSENPEVSDIGQSSAGDTFPAFDPEAINELAKQEFNPLNPLDGVDLQQYLGYQTGSSSGGFNPTKLNTLLAQQGLQYGGYGGKTGSDNDDKTGDEPAQQVTKTDPTPTPLTTTPPQEVTVTTEPEPSSQPPQPQEETEESPSSSSSELQPQQSSSSSSSSSSSQSSSQPSPSKGQSRPAFGDMGGGVNLMNPSKMIGMTSSGRPSMAGSNPRDLFSLSRGTDQSDNMFSSGSSSWGSPPGGAQSADNGLWVGTNGPSQGLTRPIMGNPMDPMGVMTSKATRQRRSVMKRMPEIRRKRQSNDNILKMNLLAFGFDPNQFMYRAADQKMNNGLGGCCSTNDNANSLAAGAGAGTGAGAASGYTSSGSTTLVSSPAKSTSATSASSSLAPTDFGNTAVSDSATSAAQDNYFSTNINQQLGLSDQGMNWGGQWPGSSASESSDTSTGEASSNTAASQIGKAINNMLQGLSIDTERGVSSSSGNSASWDGSWQADWPGFGDEHAQEQAEQTDKLHVLGNSIVSALSSLLDKNMSGAEDLTNEMSQTSNVGGASGDSGWDAHFSGQWNNQIKGNK